MDNETRKNDNDNNDNNDDDEYFGNFNTIISPTLPFGDTKQMQLRYRANLVGEKIINPAGIHICDRCQRPILVYGRMIPCKHVFCFDCVDKSSTMDTNKCIRCSNTIMKIEKCKIGTVYLCRNDSCRRTYLSQRDLEAHIQHRHLRRSSDNNNNNNTNTSLRL